MLYVPHNRAESQRLLELTRDAYTLEFLLARPLTFEGIHDVAADARLAEKGAVLDGKQLLRIADTMAAARRIRRHVESAAKLRPRMADSDDEQEQDQDQEQEHSLADPRNDDPEEKSPSSQQQQQHQPRLAHFRQLVSDFRTWPEVEVDIRTAIDDFGYVMDSGDSELRSLRKQIRDVTATIRERLQNIMSTHADAIQDRVISTRYDRFVICVKASQKNSFKGVVHDVSATGATAYVEPQAVRALNDKLRELAAREKARVVAVLRKLSVDLVGKTAEDVEQFTANLAVIDAATARARASKSLDAVDLVFDDAEPLNLRGVRHPLLSWNAQAEVEQQLGNRKTVPSDDRPASTSPSIPKWKLQVVPTDYTLSNTVRCVCVTGPNTGGKTISLKTLGIVVLMAKAGLFVPSDPPIERWRVLQRANTFREHRSSSAGHLLDNSAVHRMDEPARMPYFDHVLADIGDDQSLVQSLSTFSGHVERVKRILCCTTPRSLILLDEIGSGTDPAEGAALGMALLRHLAGATGPHLAALTFATTHHGELKTLKYDGDPRTRSLFENASMEFDDERMAPTFRLLWGIPGRSNALAIARRLGLHLGVINSAAKLLSGAEADGKKVDVSKMIAELEEQKRLAESAKLEAESTLSELETMREQLAAKLKSVREAEETMRLQYKQALDLELDAAKSKIRETIKELQRSGGGSMRAASEASGRIDEIRANLSGSATVERSDGKPVSIASIRPGYRVVVPRLGAGTMEVTEVDEARKEVVVCAGALRAKIKVGEIETVLQARETLQASGHVGGSALARRLAEQRSKEERSKKDRLVVRTSANTVDIRGERVETAENLVDLAISQSLGSGRVWIIHGHGTGRLRSGIHSFLSRHKNVARFAYAEQYDGGTGVTVADLK